MEVGEAIKMFRNCYTNINNNLIFFRDKIEILTISLFKTKLRFVHTFYISCSETSLRICSIKSWISRRGLEGYLVVKSHEIFRDQEISSGSAEKMSDSQFQCLFERHFWKSHLGSQHTKLWSELLWPFIVSLSNNLAYGSGVKIVKFV